MKRLLLIIAVILALACPTWATTYYIDYVTGSDSSVAPTSKTTPWKRHPYMIGFTGSYSHAAGDIFIFKGGVTWAYSSGDHIFPTKKFLRLDFLVSL